MSVFGPVLQLWTEENCPICLEALRAVPDAMIPGATEQQYRRSYISPGCGHEFHEACARQFARHKNTPTVHCPTCRVLWPAAEVAVLQAGVALPLPPAAPRDAAAAQAAPRERRARRRARSPDSPSLVALERRADELREELHRAREAAAQQAAPRELPL